MDGESKQEQLLAKYTERILRVRPRWHDEVAIGTGWASQVPAELDRSSVSHPHFLVHSACPPSSYLDPLHSRGIESTCLFHHPSMIVCRMHPMPSTCMHAREGATQNTVSLGIRMSNPSAALVVAFRRRVPRRRRARIT